MATTSFGESKGWLTSLIPLPNAQVTKRSRTINARPIAFLNTPQISFVQGIQYTVSRIEDTRRTALETHPAFDQRSAASLLNDSDEVSLQLTKDLSALTLSSSLDDTTSPSSVDRISFQNTTPDAEIPEPQPAHFNTNQQTHLQGIHSHRKFHIHIDKQNDLSNSSPRRYISKQPHTSHLPPLTIPASADSKSHLRPATPSPISPTTITSMKERLKSFISEEHCAFRTHTNPFPTLDQNAGWTRAYCSSKLYFLREWSPFGWDGRLDGSLEEMASIRRGYEGYSLGAQRKGMRFDEEDRWVGVFEMVFKGEIRGGRRCWKRKPGSWYVRRKDLLSSCSCCLGRGKYWEKMLHRTDETIDRVREWRARNPKWRVIQREGGRNGKRKFKMIQPLRAGNEGMFNCVWPSFNDVSIQNSVGSSEPKVKRLKVRRCKPEEVMSEQWRARRRQQERKAGRWTDGTLLQDRMWAQFHWVLDVEDPREHVWVLRKWRYRYYEGTKYRYWA
ncbi:hypothetical protein VTL71DRAFT_11949 [Oculimacula yallundae]|uniref:Uncharacterized protein n=1 Tax=Oculimacula yallundae TaxID=86028 RepID=A0ABR4CT59_9HELO